MMRRLLFQACRYVLLLLTACVRVCVCDIPLMTEFRALAGDGGVNSATGWPACITAADRVKQTRRTPMDASP